MRMKNLLHALTVCLWMLALEVYWFVAADRRRVFLYDHMGFGPFDAVTLSRYWMSGLVAAGLLLVPYLLLALAARLRRAYWLPDPLAAAEDAAPLLVGGAFLFACALGEPHLPAWVGLALAAVNCAGVYLVFFISRCVQDNGWRVLLPALDGLALAPFLVLFHAFELPVKGISVSVAQARGTALGSLLVGVVGLLALGWIYRRRRWRAPKALEILLFACAWTYLVVPAAHFLFATPPGYKYITTADNLMAQNWLLQLATWALAILLAMVGAKLRTATMPTHIT
ncbi:MAG: hypothetical protein ACYC6L_03960 [Anaerolineae bacterium]